MAKKNSIKDTDSKVGNEPKGPGFFAKCRVAMGNETFHFVSGLLLMLFAFYLVLAFASFFLTGAADQSVLENATPEQLAQIREMDVEDVIRVTTENAKRLYRIP